MVASVAEAQNKTAARAEVRSSLKGGREPKPLLFDPAKLNGLSEKLIRSHWENNYVGSVKTLNLVAERLAAAMSDAELPPQAATCWPQSRRLTAATSHGMPSFVAQPCPSPVAQDGVC
jgi:hypothetical protein